MHLELLKSKNGRTLIKSHRGVENDDVPENSWPAIKLGHQLGADLIEVDVQLSRDGVAFLRHKYQLPDGRWCYDLTWDELKQLKGEPLPLLEDVFVWARDAGAHLSLDLKAFFKPEGFLTNEVIHLLERTNMKDNVVLLFFDHKDLFQARLVHLDLTVRALLTGRLVNMVEYLHKIKADSVSLSHGMLCSEDIEEIHSINVALALIQYWNQNSDMFQQYDIDMLSVGSPVDGRRILKGQ